MTRLVETHLVLLELYLSQVHIQFKGVGSLTFQINNDQDLTLARTEKYYIENGRCLVFHNLETKMEVQYDPSLQRYRAKEITLLVILEQLKSKETIGRLRFDPFEGLKASKHWELSLSGEYSLATVAFRSKYSVIARKTPSGSLRKSQRGGEKLERIEKTERNEQKASAINELLDKESRQAKEKEGEGQKEREGEKSRQTVDRRKESVEFDRTKKVEFSRTPRKSTHSPNRTEKDRNKVHEDIEKLKRKIEQQRAEKVRSISKLKMQISPNLLLTGSKKVDEPTAINKLRERVRMLERKERNLQLSNDELQSQLEHGNTRHAQLESQREELEKVLSEKEQKIRNLQAAINALNGQLEEAVAKEKVAARREEARETTHKEQLRRVEERLRQAEEEANRANSEKNQSMKEIVEMERRQQAQLRDRDAKVQQQRTKTAKMKQEWTAIDKDWSAKLEQLTNNMQELNKMKGLLEERAKQLEQSLAREANETAELKSQLKKEKQANEQQAQLLTQSQSEQTTSTRRKISELTSESNSLREKIKKLEVSLADSNSRIKELEEAGKAKSAEMSKLTNRFHAQRKELESAVEEGERRRKELESAKTQIAAGNAKINDLKAKIDFERNRREESHNELEKQIHAFGKQREAHEAEVQELRWTVVRGNDRNGELEHKNREANEQIVRLSEELMGKTQRLAALEESINYAQIEVQQQARDRSGLELRIKELVEQLKNKTAEIEEEKKARGKVEQQLGEQKERAKLGAASNKQREEQEQGRLRQKQQIIKSRNQQLQKLQLQLRKSHEEAIALRNSSELVLREIELCKVDRDSARDQLNLLEAAHKHLQNEHQHALDSNAQLSEQIASLQQANANTTKKLESTKSELQEYKTSVIDSWRNLVSEFNKEDVSNIIALSLHSNDQILSSLYVEVLQKRNALIQGHRNRFAALQEEKKLLEAQLGELRPMLALREQAIRKEEGEERERLKSLLYESMVEKGNLAEEVKRERGEKEAAWRDCEKLRGELVRQADCEQELTGQLQMMFLEYDALRAEHADLNDTLQKSKAEIVGMRAQHEQTLLGLGEQHAAEVDKLRELAGERERRLLQVERELAELGEKARRIDSEKKKLQQQRERNSQSHSMLQHELSYLNLEVTKLNNSIRNHEKKDKEHRENKFLLEEQIKLAQTTQVQLQQQLSAAHQEAAEEAIARLQVERQLVNVQERVEELGKLLQERGEVSKEKVSKKMEENTQLRSKLIEQEANLSLKEFQLSQKDQQISTLTADNEEVKAFLTALKVKHMELQEEVEARDGSLRELTRELQQLQQEKERREEALSRGNFALFSLQAELQDMRNLEQMVHAKEQQTLKLREEKAQMQAQHAAELKKHRETASALRKDLSTVRQELDRSVDHYEHSLEQSLSASNEHKKLLQGEYERQRDDFFKRVGEIEEHNRRVIGELQGRLEKQRDQLTEAAELEKILMEQNHKKEQQNNQLRKRIDSLENELETYKLNGHKHYLQAQEVRAELEAATREYEEKLRSIGKQVKAVLARQLSLKISEVGRKVEKLRHQERTEERGEAVPRVEVRGLVDRMLNRVAELLNEIELKEDS